MTKKPLIGIIGGKGRMGNWFKRFFENLGFNVIISDIDTKLSNIDLAKKADIVMVSVPINKTVNVINQVKKHVQKNSLLCDITSLKSKPTKAMANAKSATLGTHPLFGPMVQDLQGQKIAFCKIKNNHWVDFLKTIFIKNGAEVIETSAKEHDKQMAVIQALTHFTNINIARTLYSQKIIPKSCFLTPVFRLQSLILGRILSQSPELFADTEIENPYFENILDDFNEQAVCLTKSIKEKDNKSFIKKFKQTSKYLDGFRKISQTKSTEILRMADYQPIKTMLHIKNIDLKKDIKIGFLGPEGTFSHEAALEIFPKKSKFVALRTIRDVFESVNSQESNLGIVPAENTNGGIIPETINSLINSPLKVSGSFNFDVHHCLLGRTKNKKDIKIIKSHSQALLQCRNWLAKNFPKIELENASSTTAPIIKNKEKHIGFISTKTAAKIYNLNILAENIENEDNITKFYLITSDIDKEIQKKLKAKKTLLLLAIYDRVGILHDILSVFAKNNINLTSLQSIPSHLRPWDYQFFLEVDVSYPSEKIKNVLKSISKHCSTIRVLGVS
ncbi:MAG: prephenate dehydrogenase/arogenate dehydrogenase family protein [bacterium]